MPSNVKVGVSKLTDQFVRSASPRRDRTDGVSGQVPAAEETKPL